MTKKSADFTFIRYANCWEDAAYMLHNLKPVPGERVLSIASAGDNSLAFLAFDPEQVLAFDINPAQLYLSELKQMAIKHLEYEEVLALLGFSPSADRPALFRRIQPFLSSEAAHYFSQRTQMISDGIIHAGKFERYFSIFRRRVLPLLHTRKETDQLFKARDAGAQQRFYEDVWDNARWGFMFRLFFSEFVMGRLGRDPSFFRQVDTPVAEAIYQRAARHLASSHVSGNHFLDYQLRGSFSLGLPFYMRPEHFANIKNNIDRISWVRGYLTDIPGQQAFNLINLSNIFEYMDADQFKVQAEHLKNISGKNARIAYWNLLVDRSLPAADPCFKARAVSGTDLCFFYKSFHSDQLEL